MIMEEMTEFFLDKYKEDTLYELLQKSLEDFGIFNIERILIELLIENSKRCFFLKNNF